MSTAESKVRPLYTAVIKGAVALVILAIARVILSGLPMLEELWVKSISMSGVDIAGMVISLAMAGVVFNLGVGLSRGIKQAWPHLYRLGEAVTAAAGLGALVIAYNALLLLARTLMSQDVWIYRVVFLGAACIPLYQLGRAVYLSIDDIVAFFADRSEAVLRDRSPRCPRCGRISAPGARFCAACGNALPAEVASPAAVAVCPQCGAEVAGKAAFCPQCGSPIPAAAGEEAVCPTCGAKTKSGARFCSACGAKLVKGD